MDFENLDDLKFENDEQRRKYLADLARLKRIREEAKLRKEEQAYQRDYDLPVETTDNGFQDIALEDILANAGVSDSALYQEQATDNYETKRTGHLVSGETESSGHFVSQYNKRSSEACASSVQKGEKTHKKKWWIWLVAAVLLVVLAFPVYGMFLSDSATGMYTVAVFGLDSRDGNVGKGALSDVNMIVQVNQDNGEIKLISIYRDTYVQIEEDDYYHKFNQAYHRGGPEQALWTLEHNTDIKPDDYAAFNWKAVVEGINLLGGIDLEVTDKEFAYINGFITETVNSTGIGSTQLKSPGMQHLDGVQAVAYARLRLMDNDFKRTERQRKVISLCLEKAKQADLETLITIAQAILPQIDTSMDATDLLPLLKNMENYKIVASKGWPFENVCKNIKSRGSCVVAATLESNVIELHQFLNPQPTPYTPSEGVVKSSKHIEELTGVHQIAPQPTAEEIAAAAESASQQ